MIIAYITYDCLSLKLAKTEKIKIVFRMIQKQFKKRYFYENVTNGLIISSKALYYSKVPNKRTPYVY